MSDDFDNRYTSRAELVELTELTIKTFEDVCSVISELEERIAKLENTKDKADAGC